jgi:uncharacterized oxidoreductase
MKISGRTALITGGSAGIGLALAKALRARGCTVLAVGRSGQRLALAKAACPGLHTIECDLSEDDELSALTKSVANDFGGLDLLFNNAAVMENWNIGKEPWHAALELELATNLTAPLKLISRLLPGLSAQPSAAIVNVTSALAYAPVAAIPLYCATKAALHSYTKSLRYQLKDTGVRVFELLPSTVATQMSKERFNTKMLSPEAVVSALLRGMERDRPEIRVGQAVPLYVMTRLAPSLIEPALLATPSEPRAPALGAKA